METSQKNNLFFLIITSVCSITKIFSKKYVPNSVKEDFHSISSLLYCSSVKIPFSFNSLIKSSLEGVSIFFKIIVSLVFITTKTVPFEVYLLQR